MTSEFFIFIHDCSSPFYLFGCIDVEPVNFYESGSTLIKKVGSGSKLESESVEKELEAEAIFSKSGASAFSNWLQPLGQNVTIIIMIIKNRQPWHGMECNGK